VGLVLAAAPYEEFARDNAPVLALVIIAILAILVFRVVVKTMTRMVLLSLLLLVTLFVAIERDEITECAQTCDCELAGIDTSIPFCNAELPRTGT
jgi:hypothetical protein